MADDVERRLAAILCADVVGYSALMRADEEGTLARLQAHRRELIDPMIAAHHGRIVKLMGDGVLVEFASVVNAVECAVDMQRGMAERLSDTPENRRIAFRIGINLGDIIVDEGDIYGDGVNVAARLEQIAEKGGIVISGSAYDQAVHKVDVGLKDMGPQTVKNIPEPVRAYSVLLDGEGGNNKTSGGSNRTRWVVAAGAAAALAAAIVLVVLFAFGPSSPHVEAADPAKMVFPLPDKPSIAVLPFDNLTGDPAQEYLGDGLTESIIAVLATSPDLFVIARNSSFVYKGEAVKVQEVAEQLGVRYVLEGSVQQSGDELRIIAQLVDAIDGRHLWAERFDRSRANLFALQDDITQLVLEAMHVQLTHGAQARYWRETAADPEVYRLFMQGLRAFETISADGFREAERLWSRAYELQPEGRLPINLMGWLHWQRALLGLTPDPAASFALAREFADKALAGGENAAAHSLLATLDLYAQEHEAALAHAEQALALEPSYANTAHLAGLVMTDAGQPDRGVEILKFALRLDPNYPPSWAFSLSKAHLMLGQYDAAREVAERLIAAPIEEVGPNIWYAALEQLAVCAAATGDVKAAEGYAAQMFEMHPKATLTESRYRLAHLQDRAFVERYIDALRTAGLPE